MPILPFGNKDRNERCSVTKQNPICWKEVIDIYKKDRGWENVKHSREPLTPKGKRWF